MVGLGGLEPPTPRLSSVCSNQLSYKPRYRRKRCYAIQKSTPEAKLRKADRPSALLSLSKGGPRLRRASSVSCDTAREQSTMKKEKRRRHACKAPSLDSTGDRQSDYSAIYVLIRWRRIISPKTASFQFSIFLRKEVIQPQVPLRLPCYDFTPVADPTVVACLLAVSTAPSGKTNSHGVTGGVYKARERIHRGMLIRDY